MPDSEFTLTRHAPNWTKKSLPILYSNLVYKMGQDFLGRQ